MTYIQPKEYDINLTDEDFNILAKALDVLFRKVKENPQAWSNGYLERVAALKWDFNMFWSPPDFSVEKSKYIKRLCKQ